MKTVFVRYRRARLAGALVLYSLLLLAACGGGDNDGDGDTTGNAVLDERRALLNQVAIRTEARGLICANGGARVDAGLDADGDGRLSAAETSSVQYVCNGTAGAAGATGPSGASGQAGATGATGAAGQTAPASLVRVVAEPAGTHCPASGFRIDVGTDANGNSVLDAGEVVSSDYVCRGSDGTNGTNGTNGANGAAGLTSLLAVTAEPVGSNCAYGGSRIAAGLDNDRNGALGATEVASTTYVCNPPPAGLAWIDVTATAVQAQPNTGYLANAASKVTVTLPTQPAVGDILRVNGIGTGGWSIAQNAGQSVWLGRSPFAPRDIARQWREVAVSADGSTAVASVSGARMMRSTDFGATWSPIGNIGNWYSIASSADGVHLVAGEVSGDIWTSADSGQTWISHGFSGSWHALASSADGARLVAADLNNGFIYTSSDYGATWIARESQRPWKTVASSSDGMRLVAGAQSGSGGLFVSTDAGVTWTQRAVARNWRGLASSSDGIRLVATVEYGGQIWLSDDGGLTWTARESERQWHYVASSADGQRLVATVIGGVYRSNDFGQTWAPLPVPGIWWGVAMSADGNSFIAAVDGQPIYTQGMPLRTTSGAAGAVSGNQFESIELQHAGGGTFVTLGSVGELALR